MSATRATELSLRPSRPEDEVFIRELAHESFLEYGSYDRYLEDWFRDEAVSTYIAEQDGVPAGFFMLAIYPDPERPTDFIADLVAIAVEPEHQSQGFGGRMLARALDLAASSAPPVRELWLVVAEGNARAQRLFARHGFRLREGVGVYPAGQRAMRMVKVLKGERR